MRRLALALALLIASIGAVAVTGLGQAGAASARDDDVVVCATIAKTMTDGLETFVTDMQKAGTLASGGDLTGAQAAVKDGGATMAGIAKQLRKDGARAETPRLKDLITKLSDEFESLGPSLTDLTSLRKFDTAKLAELTDSMVESCRITPAPGPSPSGTPGAATTGATPAG